MKSAPLGHVNAKLPCLFVPFPGANPRLLQTQRDSSLSSCLQTANQEQCLTVRNNYLASFALSTFQIQKGDKATLPMAQARSPSRRTSGAAGSLCRWQLVEGREALEILCPPTHPGVSPASGPSPPGLALVTNGPVALWPTKAWRRESCPGTASPSEVCANLLRASVRPL